MLRRFMLLSLVALLICGAGSVDAQNFDKFILNGSGARAAGMGYAFTGIADDATAISWNTAGLTQLYTMEASVVGRFSFGTLGTDYSFADIEAERSSKFQLNFASFVVPFKAGDYNVVGGVALRRMFDFTDETTYKASTDLGDSEFTENYTGGINAITPAIGVQFNEMLSVGAGINILTGSLEYETSDDSGFSDETWSNDFSGTAIDLGVLVKPNQQLSIGANFNLPYTLTIEEESYETDVNVPFFFSIGLGYRASAKLLLAADYGSRPWSSAEIEEDGETYEVGMEDANSLHFGLEYLAESGDSFMPLRLGFYTQPTPATDYNDDQVTYNGITTGIGIIMEKLIIDGSFEYVFGTYVGDSESDEFGDMREVEYTHNDFRITVGAALHLGK